MKRTENGLSAADFMTRCAKALAEPLFEPGKTYWFIDQYGKTHEFTIPTKPYKAASPFPQKPPQPRRSTIPPF